MWCGRRTAKAAERKEGGKKKRAIQAGMIERRNKLSAQLGHAIIYTPRALASQCCPTGQSGLRYGVIGSECAVPTLGLVAERVRVGC